MKWALIAYGFAVLVGGATLSYYAARTQPPNVPVPAADAAKFAGNYYNGDGLGVNISLTLAPDGSYAATWHGCLGLYGEGSGNWRITGKTLTLSPWMATDMIKKLPKTLDVVERDGRVVFVEPDGRDFFKKYGISRGSCFQRTDQMEIHKAG
jgi:hypothetical protein